MRPDWEASPDPLTLLQQGHSAAFETFVSQASATFLGFFRRLGAQPGEAEDLTQELFLRLLRAASWYRADGRFSAFCFRIARNLWIDQERRRAARPVPRPGEGDITDWPDPRSADQRPWEAMEQAEQGRRLLQALGELSTAHRLVFELAVVQERPYAEIASLLEIPVGTVKSRVFYCLKHLRTRLAPALPDSEPPARPLP